MAKESLLFLENLLRDPLFKQCTRQSLSHLLPYLNERSLSAKEILYSGEEEARETYLMLEGEFELHFEGGQIVRINRGFLGEAAAIGVSKYSATAIAAKQSRVLVIPRRAFANLIQQNPAIKGALIQSFANRFSMQKQADFKKPEEFEPISKAPLRNTIGWLITALFPLFILYALHQDESIPNEQALYLIAIVGSVAVMWMFQLLPDFVPALFAILMIILLGLVPPEIALGGFASGSFFMALSILGLSVLITTSGFGYRVLLLLLKIGPSNRWWYNICVFLIGLVLNPIVPTANGRVAIISPFVNEFLSLYDQKTAQFEAGRLTISALSGVSLFSAMFMSSKSINFIIYGSLPSQEQELFNWFYWLYAASVCGIVMMVLYLISSAIVFRTPGRTSLSKKTLDDQLKVLGPMRKAEWATVAGFIIIALSFATSSIHRIEIPWVALAILFGLLMFGFVSKTEFKENIDWSFLIFLGSLIGLVASMNQVGVDKWLTVQLGWLNFIMANNFPLFIILLAVAISAIRLILPINATVIIFATIFLPSAVNIGVNPWLVGFLILFLSESFVLPYQASYYSQYCSLTGVGYPSKDRRLIPYNIGLILMKLIAIYVSLPFWHYLGLL